MNKLTHFLKSTDLTPQMLGEVLELGLELKRSRGKDSPRPLDGQTWALLFYKASTRTRVSFEVGIHELGGHAMILDQKRLQTDRGETIDDTAKVLSRYIHGIIIRSYEHALIESFADACSIPVVNALTDALHPCQIISDMMTLAERWGGAGKMLESLKGRKLAFYGDCGSNMAQSWILGGALAGMEIVLCGPEGFGPGPAVDNWLKEAGLGQTYTLTSDPAMAANAADVIYTDVWVSMGDENDRENRLKEMAPFQVNESVISAAKKDTFFMHCLPAHEGEEVSSGVYHGPHSIVFDQAENRLHAQKAILSMLVSN